MTPMPALNTLNAPKFKGKGVSHFLDLLEQGIPDSLRKRIRKKIPKANLDPVLAPAIDQIIAWLKLEFKENDMDAKSADNQTSDFATLQEVQEKAQEKEEVFELDNWALSDSVPSVKKVLAAGTTLHNTQPQATQTMAPPLTMDELTKQLQELRIAQAELACKTVNRRHQTS
ncbi:hypothetical protein DXG01_003594 [Tephrocybe rancida]|nr:hypothetical protein DXG01_003594 [Tephrocybe rancida]